MKAKARIEEQEQKFWNSIKLIELHPKEQLAMDQLEPASRLMAMIRHKWPEDATCFRLGCRRLGAEGENFTVHWFPTQRIHKCSVFQLDDSEELIVPCPNEYVIAYFDNRHHLVEAPRHKFYIRNYWPDALLWSDGDRKLLIEPTRR